VVVLAAKQQSRMALMAWLKVVIVVPFCSFRCTGSQSLMGLELHLHGADLRLYKRRRPTGHNVRVLRFPASLSKDERLYDLGGH
jgi:hypothetical protein